MSSFSSLLDISSFFIGVLVNLLLVAMICFYFKRKIDNLELSQSEQAKILFQLLHKDPIDGPSSSSNTFPILNDLDLTQLGGSDEEGENTDSAQQDEDEDELSDSDDDSDDESVQKEVEVETKTIEYEQSPEIEEDIKDDSNYSKMTVKELRTLLENKGVLLGSRKLKKQELIQLASSSTTNYFPTDEPQLVEESQPEPVEEDVQPEIIDNLSTNEVKRVEVEEITDTIQIQNID